ncbi:MAG: hypothetical protein DYH12_17160, partial [Sorangiineae bacterium PRO1]|nr:hypothetical protein [Sorangiineae bacterium PRO1]
MQHPLLLVQLPHSAAQVPHVPFEHVSLQHSLYALQACPPIAQSGDASSASSTTSAVASLAAASPPVPLS